MSFDEGYKAGATGMAKAIDTAHLIATIQERKRIIKYLEHVLEQAIHQDDIDLLTWLIEEIEENK
jgi:hypothetical protein